MEHELCNLVGIERLCNEEREWLADVAVQRTPVHSIAIVPNCKRSADDAGLDAAAEAESVDKALTRGVQARLAAAASVASVKGLTPLQAISELRADTSPDAGAAWLHTASACALASSCLHSDGGSMRGSFNSYLRFARTVLGPNRHAVYARAHSRITSVTFDSRASS